MKKTITLALIGLLCLSLNATAGQHKKEEHPKDKSHDMKEMMEKHHQKMSKTYKAVAVISPTEGNDTSGVVYFKKVKDGIKVSGKIENLTPGKHGFHVHQLGDLTKSDGTSAAGHFDPKGKPHGSPDDHKRHVGDLGNIEADENGVAEFEFVDHKLDFYGPASIIGRGLIVHAGEDDLKSQPTGAAGARVGMAVIGIAKEKDKDELKSKDKDKSKYKHKKK